jgi:hypothetical protein
LTAAGIGCTKKDNGFAWVEDVAAAQALADAQGTTAWPALLAGWLAQSHPLASSLLPCPVPYYGSLETGAYATDCACRAAADLGRIYPWFVPHAYATLPGADWLRFLGSRVRQHGQPRADRAGEVTTRIKDLSAGTCVKHPIVNNPVKRYDQFGQVLRLETVLRNLRDFKVYRQREGDSDGPREYLRRRPGIADVHGRAQGSQKINERYAESLATVADKRSLAEVTEGLGERAPWKGRAGRALHPLAPEAVALLQAVSRGAFLIAGFRNRDLRALLFPGAAPTTSAEAKRRSAKVTRLLRLLRGHGLIAKIAKTQRYQLTAKGRSSLAALLAARQADTQQLLQAA